MLHIRNAYEKDIPRLTALLTQIAALHNRTRPDLFRAGSTKYGENDLKKLLKDKNTVVFVAVDNEDIAVGYIFCFLSEYNAHKIMRDNKTMYIDDICVDEDKRGLSIGRQLFDYARKYAISKNCHNITLNVWSGNADALRFYKKLGLTEQKRTLELIL
jgi:ribosomal protein S18 acetylase RimI-like enzyme